MLSFDNLHFLFQNQLKLLTDVTQISELRELILICGHQLTVYVLIINSIFST